MTDAAVLMEVLSGSEVSKDPRRHWPAFRNGEIGSDFPLLERPDAFLHTEIPPRIVGVGDKRAGHILGGVRTTISDQLLYEPGHLTINAGHETTVDLIDQAIYLLLTNPD
ncbi:cytochrome P450 [Nocardia testacea]|uniref:cytochrome P450 n=1 Tax=Nocardia testacea TaxID=248551 RepID=UPI001FDF5D9F|nr:cytochrome P450 [Nocardia testacea]